MAEDLVLTIEAVTAESRIEAFRQIVEKSPVLRASAVADLGAFVKKFIRIAIEATDAPPGLVFVNIDFDWDALAKEAAHG